MAIHVQAQALRTAARICIAFWSGTHFGFDNHGRVLNSVGQAVRPFRGLLFQVTTKYNFLVSKKLSIMFLATCSTRCTSSWSSFTRPIASCSWPCPCPSSSSRCCTGGCPCVRGVDVVAASSRPGLSSRHGSPVSWFVVRIGFIFRPEIGCSSRSHRWQPSNGTRSP